MATLRRLTDQQFSDGTTIDGSRLEKALQSIEEWSNDIPDGDFSRRWMQSQTVLSFMPFTPDEVTRLGVLGGGVYYRTAPFLPIYNSVTGSTNYFRVKGNRLYWQDATTSFQYVWSCLLATGSEPCIIDGVSVILENGNTEYTNTFHYNAAPPGQEVSSGFVRDIHIEITSDNPSVPDNQEQSKVLYHRYNFGADSVLQCPVNPGSGFPDMVPAIVNFETPTRTLSIIDKNMGLPIPPYSRIRFHLILRADSTPPQNAPWGLYPWETVRPTLTLTLLERTVRG